MHYGVQEVKRVRKELTEFFNKMVSLYGTNELIHELMMHRKYTRPEMFEALKNLGVFKVDHLSDITLFVDVTDKQFKEWGLVTEAGNYLLSGLYVVPIKDIQGDVIALVGWNPLGGNRKYITTATIGFSRDASFFNFDSFKLAHEKWGGVTYLVEGIFDTVALMSLGLPALGAMGVELSALKIQMLNRYKKVVSIPDRDATGYGVNPLTNHFSGKAKRIQWKIETDHVFVLLPVPEIDDDEEVRVKDIDDYVNNFDCYDELVECQNKKFMTKLKFS